MISNYISLTIIYIKSIFKKKDRGFVNATISNAKYLLNTFFKKNHIFIHINKTGGSSIAKALGDTEQVHLTAYTIKNFMGTKAFNNNYKFTFVRNPYDRVVSQYFYRLQHNQTNLKSNQISFKDWIRACYVDKKEEYYNFPAMFQNQLDWITDREGNLLVDFIGKFETINDDFETVCNNLNIKERTLKHERSSSRNKDFLSYYDDESLKTISEIFKKDFEYFGYKIVSSTKNDIA